MTLDIEFRPNSYFEDLDLKTRLGSKIKGQIRNQLVAEKIDNDFVPPEIFASALSDKHRDMHSAIHPWMMGGEYLPDLKEREVEICRVVLKSTTMDVTSLRACQVDQEIHYRDVDEYGDSEYVLVHKSSSEPLSMKQVIENLDGTSEIHTDSGELNDYGGGGLVKPAVYQQFESGVSPEEISDFVTVHSVFYPNLEQYYEHQKDAWIQEIISANNN